MRETDGLTDRGCMMLPPSSDRAQQQESHVNPDIVSVVPTLEPKLNARFGFCAYKLGLGPAGPAHPRVGSPVVAQVFLQGAVGPDGGAYSAPPPSGDDHLVAICTLPDGWRPKEERWFTCQVCTYIRMHDGQPRLGVVRTSGVVAVALPDRKLAYDGAVFFDGVAFFVER